MADIAIFHGVTGLEPRDAGLEAPLREGGHTLHRPDLFDGNLFETAEEGHAYVQALGFETLIARAEQSVAALPPETVLIGISMGAFVAHHLGRRRPEARGVIALHAAPLREEGDPDWPVAVPLEIHASESDPYFFRSDAAALIEEIPDSRLVLYPGSGHTFADPEVEDYDAEQAPILIRNVTEFISSRAGDSITE